MRWLKDARIKWLLVGAASYFFVASLLAQQPFEYRDPILKKGGIEYAITGVGESKADPRWATFPLKLEFATVRAELFSDIDCHIYDTNQKLVFDVKVDAPWLLVRLQPGTYYVYATALKGAHQGVKQAVTAVVPAAGQASYTLKW